ncbi:MAG: HNH endonuclease [Actinomycetota bacterium]|nr:HNH endonuclease [Actinomycetota bacterium]
MSSIEVLQPRAAPAAGAVRAALSELTHAVDVLQSESLDGLDDHEVLAVFQGLETQRRRLPTVDHRLIVELECRGTATKLLARGTAGLLTELVHVDVAEAKARVRAAGVLGPRTAVTGEALDPVYAATAAAQAAGTISEKHARIVTTTIGALPHSLDVDTTALAEKTLVDQAEGLRPSELAKVAERLTAYLDPDGQLSDDTDRAARRALNIGRQRADGMSPITGLLDPATRALVDAAFSTLARPVSQDDIPDPRSAAQRHHDALAALCRNALASGTLPSNRGLPATVVITMTIDQLEDAAGVATTATGGVVSIRDALAMATDAYPVLCLFNRDGQPLYLGRGARLASAAQRLALYARDKGCTRPGCDMPAQWTQVHHLDEYQYGGLTDVDKMCLVCPFDHPLITDHGFTVRMGPDGRVEWIAPKHLDPSQTPRINTIHHPPDLSDPDPP